MNNKYPFKPTSTVYFAKDCDERCSLFIESKGTMHTFSACVCVGIEKCKDIFTVTLHSDAEIDKNAVTNSLHIQNSSSQRKNFQQFRDRTIAGAGIGKKPNEWPISHVWTSTAPENIDSGSKPWISWCASEARSFQKNRDGTKANLYLCDIKMNSPNICCIEDSQTMDQFEMEFGNHPCSDPCSSLRIDFRKFASEYDILYNLNYLQDEHYSRDWYNVYDVSSICILHAWDKDGNPTAKFKKLTPAECQIFRASDEYESDESDHDESDHDESDDECQFLKALLARECRFLRLEEERERERERKRERKSNDKYDYNYDECQLLKACECRVLEESESANDESKSANEKSESANDESKSANDESKSANDESKSDPDESKSDPDESKSDPDESKSDN